MAGAGTVAEVKWAALSFSYLQLFVSSVNVVVPSPTALKKWLCNNNNKNWAKDAHVEIPLGCAGAGGQQGMDGTGWFLSDGFLAFDQNIEDHVSGDGVCATTLFLACAKDSAKPVTTLPRSRKWNWAHDLIIFPPSPGCLWFCGSPFAERLWITLQHL